jgi:DNA-binding response OmpR family regulator
LKIILLSGSPTVESVIDALRMRVFDFVVKPFYLKDLKEIVDRALTGTRERTTTGIMRRRIDMLETMLQRHGLTPPDGGAPETGLVSEKERSVVAAESGPGRRGKAGGRP